MAAAKPPDLLRKALDLVAIGVTLHPVSEGFRHHLRYPSPVDGPRGRGLWTRRGLGCAEKRELVELRRKTRVLEIEDEILKPATAYFARENFVLKYCSS